MFDVFELQKKLVAAALPPGFESRVTKVIEELAKPYCDEMYYDAMGSLFCRVKGEGKRIMFAAHTDVIGFIAKYIDDSGVVWIDRIGFHRTGAMINTPVVFENGVIGVLKVKELSRFLDGPMNGVPQDEFFVDIGATCKEQAEKLVKVGDVAKFAHEPMLIGNGKMVMGPYADDIIGCVVQLLALQQTKKGPNDVYYVFTAQEESGIRGAIPASFSVEPYMGFSVDIGYSGDTPEHDDDHMLIKLGDGPTVKLKDSALVSAPQAIAHLRKAAEKSGVKTQDEILVVGGTDASAIQKAKAGAYAGGTSISTRNIHSPVEIFSISDVEGCAKLIAAAAQLEL